MRRIVDLNTFYMITTAKQEQTARVLNPKTYYKIVGVPLGESVREGLILFTSQDAAKRDEEMERIVELLLNNYDSTCWYVLSGDIDGVPRKEPSL